MLAVPRNAAANTTQRQDTRASCGSLGGPKGAALWAAVFAAAPGGGVVAMGACAALKAAASGASGNATAETRVRCARPTANLAEFHARVCGPEPLISEDKRERVVLERGRLAPRHH